MEVTTTRRRVLRRPEVEERVGLARSTIYKLVSENAFPAPIRLSGARSVGWIESEIDAWLESRERATGAQP